MTQCVIKGTVARLIKRYENRKLYDTASKRYISLEEIAELIRGGEEITVIDNATGADLTAPTLARIILEEQTGSRGPIPPQFLHELLRSGGQLVDTGMARLQRNLDRLMEASLGRLARVRETRAEVERLRKRLKRLEEIIDEMNREGRDGIDSNG
jgi:polyhydroxyalkanoate synthesis repressor PhaR